MVLWYFHQCSSPYISHTCIGWPLSQGECCSPKIFHKVNFTGNVLTSYFHLKLDTALAALHTQIVFVSLSFQGSFQHLSKWRQIPAVHPSSLLNSLVSLRWIHSLLGKKRKRKKNTPFSSSVTSKKAASLTRSRPLGRRQQHTQTNQERRTTTKRRQRYPYQTALRKTWK